jgi:hypothetical protein
MSERLERWKAAEKVRGHVGWLAILLGLSGAAGILSTLFLTWLEIRGAGLSRLKVSGIPIPDAVAVPFVLLIGAALLLCARGLWRVRPWARWTIVAMCAASLVGSALEGLREHEVPWGAALPLSLLVYLFLPSTARLFARAQGSQSDTLSTRPAREASS